MPAASNRSIEARLTRKVGPLPVWGWAAVILGAYLLYSRFAGKAAAAPLADTTAVPAAGDPGSAQVPASGQGSPADNLSGSLLDALSANTSSIDALTSQILSQPLPFSEFGDTPLPGAPVGPATYTPPAAEPTPPARTQQVAAVHQTQTTAGLLSWDGLNFSSRTAFDRWAGAHGTSSAAIFKTHPQAKAIYQTLKP